LIQNYTAVRIIILPANRSTFLGVSKIMTTMRLSAKEISVDFSGLRALDGVNLDVAVGEIVGLIGPNGSGKTTLINVITGQVTPVSGSVSIDGEEITLLSPRKIALKGITRSFQIVRLFEKLTVQKNVETTALAKGASRKKAGKLASTLLKEFHLNDLADLLAGTLSYGDKRRVEIVRALAGEPHFLLLDEPAAGINPELGRKIFEKLKDISNNGIAFFIVEHRLEILFAFASLVYVMDKGRIVIEGQPQAIIEDPAFYAIYLGEE